MSKVEKISVALPREMVGEIKSAVDGGEYATVSEVVREALRDWRLKRRFQSLEVEELRRLVLPAVAELERGEGLSADEVFADLKARYSAKKAPASRGTT